MGRQGCIVVVLAITACGRIGFDDNAGPGDAIPVIDGSGVVPGVLDRFNAIAYTNNDGMRQWTTPWLEVGDDGSELLLTNATIFVESHVENPTANTPALKVRVATAGQYVYREANLAGATMATLSYRYHNELQTSGAVEVQVSPNGGAAWTTLRSYAAADMFGDESIVITQYAAANTRVRIIATVAGGRHFRIDDVGINFQ